MNEGSCRAKENFGKGVKKGVKSPKKGVKSLI